ncbi:hypothetical protein B0T22DRAFT_411815 [Podospora appendiculata]|uniref:KOW domain-containing protein n=1 Tax=Podospora appendiculata TaxID=314037 RepID=A0AAE1C908_9PEZI|nr:hypothetical protein B0T22DRAFT_411815 [Podospora appendiculata]
MDKILRRVRMAEGQVVRRTKRRSAERHGLNKSTRRQNIQPQRAEVGAHLAAAVRARTEDMRLGPLAPRRDVSVVDQSNNYWGTISPSRAMLDTKLTDDQRKARCAWAGGEEYLCLAAGDRVVVQEGPYKDKIGVIEGIDRKAMAVEISNDLRVNVSVPEYMVEEGSSTVQVIGSLVPISSVRLVYPVKDRKTGVVRDVIIRELKAVEIRHDRPTRTKTWKRVVPGENIAIPWPKKPEQKFADHPVDTLRILVEERTFVPTLLSPPMPQVVVNELRNAYSIFRTRHTPEYIAQKEAEAAAKDAKKRADRAMLLPVQAFNRQQRELRRARGQPLLTDEMLAKIGQVIAKNKLGEVPAGSDADAAADKLQSAVEQLSINVDDVPSTTSENRPPSS